MNLETILSDLSLGKRSTLSNRIRDITAGAHYLQIPERGRSKSDWRPRVVICVPCYLIKICVSFSTYIYTH